MNEKDKKLIQDVQRQCLSDPEGLVSALKQNIFKMKDNQALPLQEILRILHSLKGNFQAAGFLYFSQWLHDWESVVLYLIEKGTVNQPLMMQAKFIEAVKLRMNNLVVSLDNYVFLLKQTFEDKVDLYENRKESLQQLHDVFEMFTKNIPSKSEPIKPKIAEYGFFIEDSKTIPAPAVVTKHSDFKPSLKEALPTFSAPSESGFDYLICRHRKSYYAIPSAQVLEIIDVNYFNPAPFSTGNMSGYIVYRGEPLAVLRSNDLLPLSFRKKHMSVIIASVKNMVFGFEVESVESIEKIGPSRMQIPPILHALPPNSWIVGVGFSEKTKVFVLDLEKALLV